MRRCDVAVGTAKLASMFSTILSAAPRSGIASACGVAESDGAGSGTEAGAAAAGVTILAGDEIC